MNENTTKIRVGSVVREYSGYFSWFMFVFAIVSYCVHIGVTYYALKGDINLWLACFINTIGVYLIFTPMHEAAHYNISGGNPKLAWLDDLIGWVCSVFHYAPYAAFRVLHHQHHKNTNNPERDPDYFVLGDTIFTSFIRCFLILPYYYISYLFKFWNMDGKKEKEFGYSIAMAIIKFGLSGYLVYIGYGAELVALWIAPAVFGTCLLAIVFDFIPHYPHKSQNIYENSWIYPRAKMLCLVHIW